MEIKIDKSFRKDTRKISNKNILQKVARVITETQKARELSEIKHLKKLKGSGKEYRIKVGDYRLGIIIEDETVEFVRCLHRKDIYKYFPKIRFFFLVFPCCIAIPKAFGMLNGLIADYSNSQFMYSSIQWLHC
jgi:mRNA interferase RelE/StbE